MINFFISNYSVIVFIKKERHIVEERRQMLEELKSDNNNKTTQKLLKHFFLYFSFSFDNFYFFSSFILLWKAFVLFYVHIFFWCLFQSLQFDIIKVHKQILLTIVLFAISFALIESHVCSCRKLWEMYQFHYGIVLWLLVIYVPARVIKDDFWERLML